MKGECRMSVRCTKILEVRERIVSGLRKTSVCTVFSDPSPKAHHPLSSLIQTWGDFQQKAHRTIQGTHAHIVPHDVQWNLSCMVRSTCPIT